MKLLLLLFLFLVPHNESAPFAKFIKIIPPNWTYKVNAGTLIITRNDSIEIKNCNDISPLRDEDTVKRPYIITIEAVEKFSKEEIKKREILQDSILAQYQKDYDSKRDKITYSNLHWFKRNTPYVDSLRIPFYSHKKYSYFIQHNLRGNYCIIRDSINEEIRSFEKKIYNLK